MKENVQVGIIALTGTMTNPQWRLERGEVFESADDYHALANNDPIFPEMIDVTDHLKSIGAKIIFYCERPSKFQKPAMHWILTNTNLRPEDFVIILPDVASQDDSKIFDAIATAVNALEGSVIGAWDSRMKNLEALSARGVRSLHLVRDGKPENVIIKEDAQEPAIDQEKLNDIAAQAKVAASKQERKAEKLSRVVAAWMNSTEDLDSEKAWFLKAAKALGHQIVVIVDAYYDKLDEVKKTLEGNGFEGSLPVLLRVGETKELSTELWAEQAVIAAVEYAQGQKNELGALYSKEESINRIASAYCPTLDKFPNASAFIEFLAPFPLPADWPTREEVGDPNGLKLPLDWAKEAAEEVTGHSAQGKPEFKQNGDDVPLILEECAAIFRERRAQYGTSRTYERTGAVMAALFPDGVRLVTEADHRAFHMFGHVINKLTRFASSGMRHVDSLRDCINYIAFCEVEASKHEINSKELTRPAD